MILMFEYIFKRVITNVIKKRESVFNEIVAFRYYSDILKIESRSDITLIILRYSVMNRLLILNFRHSSRFLFAAKHRFVLR